MPSERLNSLDNMAEDIHVRHAAQVLDEIEAHASDPALLQRSIILVGERLIDDGDAAITAAACGDGIEHGTVLGAVTARLNNHASLNSESFVQGRQALLGGVGRRIGAVRGVGKFRRGTEDMAMSVASQ